MKAISKTLRSVFGSFVCQNVGKRTQEVTDYPWALEAAAVIAGNAGDTAEWLKLADRLEEEGNPAHHMIRAVFVDGYQPPAGLAGHISRSGSYYENGSNYSEGCYFQWKRAEEGHEGAGLYTTYYSNGNFTRTATVAEAREALAVVAGRRAGSWSNLSVGGEFAPTAGALPVGSSVEVRQSGNANSNWRKHTTAEAVPVPVTELNDSRYYWTQDRTGRSFQVVEFVYRGWVVKAEAGLVDVW